MPATNRNTRSTMKMQGAGRHPLRVWLEVGSSRLLALLVAISRMLAPVLAAAVFCHCRRTALLIFRQAQINLHDEISDSVKGLGFRG